MILTRCDQRIDQIIKCGGKKEGKKPVKLRDAFQRRLKSPLTIRRLSLE